MKSKQTTLYKLCMLYENNCKLFIITTYLFVPGSLKYELHLLLVLLV